MPILWPLKVPERGNAITRRKTLEIEYSCLFIHHTIWIYPFPHHLFNTPKKSLLKSSYPKKYLPIFRTQKNPGIENFKPKKTLWSSPSLEIPSTPLGLQSSLPKKILAKLFYQKNSGIENVKSKKKTFNHPHDLEIRISPCPARWMCEQNYFKTFAFNTHCLPYPAGRVSFILPWKIYPAREQSLKSKLQHPLPVNPLDIWFFFKN